MNMRSLDYIISAVRRELAGDAAGASWVFHHCMDEAARLRFDRFLVDSGDALAYQAGTTESRFVVRVRRIVNLQRTGELESVA